MAEPYDCDDPRDLLVASVRRFFEFCTDDPARYQLLFQRTLPGFEPSPSPMRRRCGRWPMPSEWLALNGVTEARHLDMWTALVTGLVDQQVSNDPGGDRWTRLIDESMAMFLAHCQSTECGSPHPGRRSNEEEPDHDHDDNRCRDASNRWRIDEAMRLQAHELESHAGVAPVTRRRRLVGRHRLPRLGHPSDVPARAGRMRSRRVHARERPPTASGRAHRKQHGGPLEAALSAVQVRERADLSPAQIVERLATVAPKTVRGRTRTPALVRNHAKMAVDGPVHETWKLGYLIDTIYLRDLWMHRIDVAHALARPSSSAPTTTDGSSPTSSPNGHAATASPSSSSSPARRVASTHTMQRLRDAERLSLDAVEFCRTLAGRRHGDGLLATDRPVLRSRSRS